MVGKVEMVPVQSSNIREVGYQGGTLHVRFVGGGRYSYAGVPPEVFHEGVKSDSVGRWFQHHVRGKYAHQAHPDE